jgi:hypothetical protein
VTGHHFANCNPPYPGEHIEGPVNNDFGGQALLLREQADDGLISEADILPVRFVRLTRQNE